MAFIQEFYDNSYNGNYFYYIYLASLIVLIILLKGRRLKFILPSIVLSVVIFNPVFYKCWNALGLYAYWRILWAIPLIPICAALPAAIAERIKNEKLKVFCGILCVLIFIPAGTFIYSADYGHFDVVASNAVKLPSPVPAIAEYLLEQDEDPRIIAVPDISVYIRQYSGQIETMYGRDIYGYIYAPNENAGRVNEAITSDDGDMDFVAKLMKDEGYEFLVVKSGDYAKYQHISNAGLKLLDTVEGYDIYKPLDRYWTVTQYGNVQGGQSSFYTIEDPDGGLTIIDGGYDYQYEEVYNVIQQYNGHVKNWILSHPHLDHIGAFNRLMSDPEMSKSIQIDTIYATPVNEERYEETAQEYDRYQDYLDFKEIAKDLDNIVYVSDGDEYDIAGLDMKIISAWDEDVDSLPDHLCNDGSLMFKLSGVEVSMLFCSDVQSEMEQFILPEYEEDIKADYVQCGHHGNWGVSMDFYDKVSPSVAFLDAPNWLFETRDDIYDGYKTVDHFNETGVKVYTFEGAPHSVILY